LGAWVVRASLAMVCMMFIVHTISECQQAFNVCSPDAYRFPGKSAGWLHNPGWKLLDAVYPGNLESFARCLTLGV